MDLEAVLREVGNWPVEDRLRLVEEVWETIAGPPGTVDLSESRRQDLRRRLDAFRHDPGAGSPWEEVEARLRGRGR